MDALIIEGSKKIPTVNFNAESGILELSGISLPEDSITFYKELLDWLDAYKGNAKPQTTVNVRLVQFNTSSSKCILDVLKKLASIHTDGISEVMVNWHYEEDDEDLMEAGEDYQSIVNVPFRLIEVDDFRDS